MAELQPPPLPPPLPERARHAWLDISKLRGFDTETLKFSSGRLAPRVVCASTSEIGSDGLVRGTLVPDARVARELFRHYLERGYVIVLANAAYDLAVMAEADPTLLPLIFEALREGRIYDILPAQALDAIAGGHLGYMPNNAPLVNPATGDVTTRYSLPLVALLVLGRADVKDNDVWRESYALLEDVPRELWPPQAKQYPVDDAVNTLEIAVAQIFGQPGKHDWQTAPRAAGDASFLDTHICRYCGLAHNDNSDGFRPDGRCDKAPRIEPHRNLNNLTAQLEAAFALHLGACHGLRTDPERVAKLREEVEAKHKIAVERFQKKGWIRADGTEDQSAVKRAIALAYGARGVCPRCRGGVACRKCDGTGHVLVSPKSPDGICRNCDGVGTLVGKVVKVEIIDCRGEKVGGRYRNCAGAACAVCSGSGKIKKLGDEVSCKNVFDESGVLQEEGCDGTGLNLQSVPLLPRTDKLGVKTDRDVKMESGDDDMSDYGEDEAEKILTTYLPYVQRGVDGVLNPSPNTLVASGRCSYDTIHQFPRKGGVRETIRARGAWCGYPIETVLVSSDYSAGELCSLSQVTYWYTGESQMMELINRTKDPGSLHTMIAAQMLGTTLEDVKARIKAGDQQAKDFRQAAKPASFGFPGGLGSATLVLTNRRKNAGMTTTKDGHVYAGIRFCVLIGGAERCGLEKVIEWNRKPCPPVCAACVRIVEELLKPTFFRSYPEVKKYLDRISAMTDSERNGGRRRPIPAPAWNQERGEIEILRLRGECGYTDGSNQGFQGLLADIGKRALVRMTREAYLGVKEDGSPSPLAGARFPVFMHDEPLAEVAEATAHESAPRISQIMMECGRELAPDVYWHAEPALMRYWYKGAEPVYLDGKLTIWEPKKAA